MFVARGIIPAMVTPFDDNDRVNEKVLRKEESTVFFL